MLLESNLQLERNAIYHRYEFVQKSQEELDIINDHYTKDAFNIHSFTLGYNRILYNFRWIDLVGGAQGSVYFPEGQLAPLYGSWPLAGQIYIQLRPSLHDIRAGSKVILEI